MFFVGFALLSTACAHYPHQHSYYYGGYSGEYTMMHRNYYGYGGANYPHHHHQRYNVPHRWNSDYSGRHQRGGSHDHSFNYRNRNNGNRQKNFSDRHYH